jgi:hypothetical protein
MSRTLPRPESRTALARVSAYDRAASLLIATLVLLGLSVLVLLFAFLAGQFAPLRERTVPVVIHEGSGGDPTSADSSGMLLDVPATDAISKETSIPLESFQETIEAVDRLVKTREADIIELLAFEPSTPSRTTGSGDSPAAGTGGGAGGIARRRRWEIYYEAGTSLDEYARRLDFFGIELAAVSGDGSATYARDLSKPVATIDRARPGPERRLTMTWQAGSPRRETDRKLLEKVGVETLGHTLVQCLPAELESKLERLEYDFAKRTPDRVEHTRFAIRAAGQGYEMYVAEQTGR